MLHLVNARSVRPSGRVPRVVNIRGRSFVRATLSFSVSASSSPLVEPNFTHHSAFAFRRPNNAVIRGPRSPLTGM